MKDFLRSIKKHFGIEIKIKDIHCSEFIRNIFRYDWRLWRRYKYEKSCEESLKTLLSNYTIWEYRKVIMN